MRNCYILLLSLLLLASCSDDKHLRISGTIKNSEGKQLSILLKDIAGDRELTQIRLESDGKFEYETERLVEPQFFTLALSPTNFITILADSCEKIEIVANASNLESSYSVKNSKGAQQIKDINNQFIATRKSFDSLAKQYKSAYINNPETKNKIEQELNIVVKKHRDYVGTFVMSNPRSFASYYALFQKLDDGTQLLNVSNPDDQLYFATLATSLHLYYPNSQRVNQFYDYVLQTKKSLQQEKVTSSIIESANAISFPDIEENNVKGEKVKLSSLKGKVILLSFWASWDRNTRNENRNLKKIYQQFKGRGFEIYQVSVDKSKVLWEEAILTDDLPWINVCDFESADSYPARLYNVQALPANFLINRNGEIIGKNLFGSRLEDKLHELLQ